MIFKPFTYLGSQNSTTGITSGSYIYLNSFNLTSYPGTGNTWNDLSGNALNGILYTNADYSTIKKFFLGKDVNPSTPRWLNITGTTTAGTDPLTINMWVNTTALIDIDNLYWAKSGADNAFLCTTTNGGIGGNPFRFGVTAKMANGTQLSMTTGTTTIATNTWYYVSTTWQPAVSPSTGYNLSVYVNGVLQGSTSGAYNSTYTTLSTGGTAWYSGRYGSGADANGSGYYLGQFELYKSALSATDILNNFNGTKINYGY